MPHIKVQNVCYQYRTNTSLKIHTTAILYFYRSIIPHILIHSIRNTNRVLYTSSQNWNYNKRKNKKNMVLCTIFFLSVALLPFASIYYKSFLWMKNAANHAFCIRLRYDFHFTPLLFPYMKSQFHISCVWVKQKMDNIYIVALVLANYI